MVRRYFGTDGIRGRANRVITPELALKVGQAAGLVFKNGEHRHRVLIGKDTRLSGYMIETALVAGFTSVGMDVLLTGPIPTPAVGMLARSMRADLGVMISASHNPLRRQRHQAVRAGRLQAQRRGRKRDRGADRFRSQQAAWPKATISAAPSASTACRTAISNSPSARCPRRSICPVCALLSIAPMAPPTKSRPARCGSWAPTWCRSASTRTA